MTASEYEALKAAHKDALKPIRLILEGPWDTWQGFFVCPLCGALVGDTGTHIAHHESMIMLIRNAALISVGA